MGLPLFDRRSELILENGYSFTRRDGVIINFRYTTLDELGIPICEIEILNIKDDLRNVFTSSLKVIFNIGFGSFLGELVSGYIRNVEEEGTTIKFEIMSDSKKFLKKYSQWYDRYVREDFIVRDIATNLGLTINGAELLEEFRRPNGATVRGTGIGSIRKICNARGLGVTTYGNIIKIYKIDDSGVVGSVLLKYDSGLTNVTKYTKEDKTYDYIVHSLPIPTISQGDLIKVEHEKLNGVCKILDIEIDGKTNWKAKYYVRVVG